MYAKKTSFKSLMPDIADVEAIKNHLCYPLNRQHIFEKRTSPLEMKFWNDEQLELFRIIPEELDRLYYINYADSLLPTYYLLARTNNKLYVEMIVNHNRGTIYVSYDANLFMNIVFRKLNPREFYINYMINEYLRPNITINTIIQSLRDDNIYFNHLPRITSRISIKNPFTLQNLCYKNIYILLRCPSYKDIRNHLKSLKLPKTVQINMENIVQYQDAIIDYEDWSYQYIL